MVDVVAKFTLPRSSRKACFAILRNGYSWQSKLCDYIYFEVAAMFTLPFERFGVVAKFTLPFGQVMAEQALRLHRDS